MINKFSNRDEFINYHRNNTPENSYYLSKIDKFKDKKEVKLSVIEMSALESYCNQKIWSLDGNKSDNIERIKLHQFLINRVINPISYELIRKQMDTEESHKVGSSKIFDAVDGLLDKKQFNRYQLEEYCLFLGKVFDDEFFQK